MENYNFIKMEFQMSFWVQMIRTMICRNVFRQKANKFKATLMKPNLDEERLFIAMISLKQMCYVKRPANINFKSSYV